MSYLSARVITMSYMKRLLETFESVSKDTLMHELLWNSCPIDQEYNSILDVDVNTYKISLHCDNFLVKCIYDNETQSFTIIEYEKENHL